MSEETKPVAHPEPWTAEERQGAVDMQAMTITLEMTRNPVVRELARGIVSHLMETHGFKADAAREESLRIQADALRFIAKSITTGTDLYGGGEVLLRGVASIGKDDPSKKGN